jgi:uncharacterized coiled-coil DUF342 family protein
MEKKMKTIKKYWAIIIGAIIALGGIIMSIILVTKTKKLDKLDKQIDDNKQKVDNLQGKVEVVEEQRQEVKDEIKQQEQIISDLKQQKETVTVEEPKTVKEAKENILNKTRRGRKPNKK